MTSDSWAVLGAIATTASAIVIAYQSIQTKKSVGAAKQGAEAAAAAVLPQRFTQPQPGEQLRADLADDFQNAQPDVRCLEVERQVIARAAFVDQFGKCGNERWQLTPAQITDSATAESTADHAVVFEYGHAVARQPDIAFETRRTQFESQLEGFDGVLRRVRFPAAVYLIPSSPRNGRHP